MEVRTKEFHSREVNGKRTGVGTIVDRWLRENRNIAILDIKYSANSFSSHALVIYKEV